MAIKSSNVTARVEPEIKGFRSALKQQFIRHFTADVCELTTPEVVVHLTRCGSLLQRRARNVA